MSITDGSVHLNHGGTEMGQGLYVKVAQVVAEEFGMPLDRVQITATTTAEGAEHLADGGLLRLRPQRHGGAGGRRDDQGAAGRLRSPRRTGSTPIDVALRATARCVVGNAAMAVRRAGRSRPIVARVQLSAAGFYATPKIHWDRDKAKGRPFLYFAYGAACSEVTIDTLTGEMRVDRVDILHDCGTSLNPAIDIGQIEGGFVQGMGWLTTEELVCDAKGRLRTHAPSTYKIPRASRRAGRFPRARSADGGGNREDDDLPLQGRRRAAADAGDVRCSRRSSTPSPACAPGRCRRSTRRRRRRRSCGPSTAMRRMEA